MKCDVFDLGNKTIEFILNCETEVEKSLIRDIFKITGTDDPYQDREARVFADYEYDIKTRKASCSIYIRTNRRKSKQTATKGK